MKGQAIENRPRLHQPISATKSEERERTGRSKKEAKGQETSAEKHQRQGQRRRRNTRARRSTSPQVDRLQSSGPSPLRETVAYAGTNPRRSFGRIPVFRPPFLFRSRRRRTVAATNEAIHRNSGGPGKRKEGRGGKRRTLLFQSGWSLASASSGALRARACAPVRPLPLFFLFSSFAAAGRPLRVPRFLAFDAVHLRSCCR